LDFKPFAAKTADYLFIRKRLSQIRRLQREKEKATVPIRFHIISKENPDFKKVIDKYDKF